jgi:hypothetical protein
MGSVFFAVGCILFAFAWQLPFDGYLPGYFFLALGGPFVFISSFQLSNTFPKHSGLILSMLTGAFDASSAIFLIYRLVYMWSGHSFWPKKFFLAYLIVPLFIFIAQIFLMPQHSYKTVGELVEQAEDSASAEGEGEVDEETALLCREHRRRRESVVSEITELLGSKTGAKQVQQEQHKKNVSGVWGVLHGQTAFQQIRSPWFLLITLFTVVQMTRINYFVATVRPQYEFLFGDYSKAVHVNTFFDIALPLGGLIAVPFIGVILDNTSTPLCLSMLIFMATVIGILGILPYMWAAYTNIILFVIYRPFYYTTVS